MLIINAERGRKLPKHKNNFSRKVYMVGVLQELQGLQPRSGEK